MLNEINLIKKLINLTKNKKLYWKKIIPDYFEANCFDDKLSVEFIYFIYSNDNNDNPPFKSLIRINMFGVIFDYCIGTKEYNLICDMLSINYPEWLELNVKLKKLLNEGMKKLKKLEEIKNVTEKRKK